MLQYMNFMVIWVQKTTKTLINQPGFNYFIHF